MSKENPRLASAQDRDRVRELDVDRGDEQTGRIGDPKPEKEIREECPGRREREPGMTGGETPEGDVTADDPSPESRLDSDSSRTPGRHADANRPARP